MQHQITKPSNLLNKHGELIQKGYATSPILKYIRRDVACKFRLKEWDYYLIYNDKYAVALTVGKSSAALLISASLIDFTAKQQTTKSLVRIVSGRTFTMPESSQNGDIIYQDSEVKISFRHHNGKRELYLFMRDFKNSPSLGSDSSLLEQMLHRKDDQVTDIRNLEVSLTLSHELGDSMVIATPFYQSRKEFYYNQKIIGMYAMGKACYGDQVIHFPFDQSFGLLDWGRGVWPYHTTWYWSACQGMLLGNLFGFNLGYGFGNTSAATENMLFFNGSASKLEKVVFHIPKNEDNEYDYMKPWAITSSDHRLDLIFTPILDRSADLSAVVLSTEQHQVFGSFTGAAILDHGKTIYLKDFPGFAERVENRW